MSSWETLNFKFAPFDPLKPPLQSVLTIMQTVESILESLLDLVKTFLVDFGNPVKSIIALLLAAIRAIINQIKSAGFSILLVHPDFSRGDFGAVIQSVSGGYQAFESKVVNKFYDQSDIFRPDYPPAYSVAMFVFYIGTESPIDLMTQLMALLSLIRHPVTLTGLPAPVELTVKPVFKSNDGIQQAISSFQDLFSSELDTKLVLEWRMPSSPSAANGPAFTNSLVSFYNSFRFPNFVVERSEIGVGEEVLVELNTSTSGASVFSTIEKYDFPLMNTKTEVREYNGNTYRHFSKKFPASLETGLRGGQFTGNYQYVDSDPDLVPGKSYYYRVRAYFGTPTDYLNTKEVVDVVNSKSLLRKEGDIVRIDYGQDVVMGLPSSVVRGFCPRPPKGPTDFNVNSNVYDAVMAGLLLNFELPPAAGDDPPERVDQKIGWGSLALLGGQVGPLKLAFGRSDIIRDVVFFKWMARRLADTIAGRSYTKPELLDVMGKKWNAGVAGTVHQVLSANFSWGVFGIDSGITEEVPAKIDAYLSEEDNYTDGGPFNGPYPTSPRRYTSENIAISPQDRQDLADFLRLCIATSSNTSYLHWHSVTVADLFPAFIPFLFDFEQFALGLLKAVDSVLKEIEAIVENLISKIQQLEAILQTILDLIDLLSISARVGVLAVSSTNGSSQFLVDSLTSSQNKPGSAPQGLHSGMVVTFGGPNESFNAGFSAIKFILGM